MLLLFFCEDDVDDVVDVVGVVDVVDVVGVVDVVDVVVARLVLVRVFSVRWFFFQFSSKNYRCSGVFAILRFFFNCVMKAFVLFVTSVGSPEAKFK